MRLGARGRAVVHVEKDIWNETYEFGLDGVGATGGTLVSTAGVAIPAEALHPTAGDHRQGDSRLITRSSPECRLYIALHPCECGERELPTECDVLQGEGMLMARYRGACPRCTCAREFVFTLDPEMPPPDAFGGNKPSRIICPGQFALYSDRLASRWPADQSALSAADRTRARDDLFWAIRALEEVVKCIPEGSSEVPSGAFTSPEGRAAFEAEPGRFRKIRLHACLTAYRELLSGLDSIT